MAYGWTRVNCFGLWISADEPNIKRGRRYAQSSCSGTHFKRVTQFCTSFFFCFLVGPVWRWVLEKFPGQQCFCLSINIFFLKIKNFFLIEDSFIFLYFVWWVAILKWIGKLFSNFSYLTWSETELFFIT